MKLIMKLLFECKRRKRSWICWGSQKWKKSQKLLQRGGLLVSWWLVMCLCGGNEQGTEEAQHCITVLGIYRIFIYVIFKWRGGFGFGFESGQMLVIHTPPRFWLSEKIRTQIHTRSTRVLPFKARTDLDGYHRYKFYYHVYSHHL